jgi:hypothetical protein
LTTQDGECGWPAKVRDLSAGGIGLSVGRRFEPGTVLLVELIASDEESALPVPVRVVHATPEGGDRWILGCAFRRTLDDEKLRALLKVAENSDNAAS